MIWKSEDGNVANSSRSRLDVEVPSSIALVRSLVECMLNGLLNGKLEFDGNYEMLHGEITVGPRHEDSLGESGRHFEVDFCFEADLAELALFCIGLRIAAGNCIVIVWILVGMLRKRKS